MSGLEVLAIIPFCVAAWRLSRKVSEQQLLIEQHETTITSQQEVLKDLVQGHQPTVMGHVLSSRVLVFGSVAAAGALTLHYTYKLSTLRRNVEPPAGYSPSTATHEAEQCAVCLENRKDTFFSPCQHLCTCWPCSRAFRGRDCPVCRQPVEYTQFTYV